MPKISQSMGFTFHVGPSNLSQYAKVNIEILDIDTTLPLEPQLDGINVALDKVWVYIKDRVEKEMENILNEGNND